MRILREIDEKLTTLFEQLFIDTKALKTASYFYIALIIVFFIFTWFSFEHTGSSDLKDLFKSKNINFTYAGTPDYAHVYSSYLNIGIGGVNDSHGDLSIQGKSNMTLYPTGDILLMLDDGTSLPMSGSLDVYTLPGGEANVTISVSREDDFTRSMRLIYSNESVLPDVKRDTSINLLKIIKKNNGQYMVSSKFAPGPSKDFRVYNNDPRWDFPIDISGKNIGINNSRINNVKKISYQGQIHLSTNDGLEINIPASSTSGAGSYRVKLIHSLGKLDVRHNEYDCNLADNITIIPVKNISEIDNEKINDHTYVSLVNGHVLAYGQADQLEFREQDFSQPINVLIKEGKFALVTGLLFSFLTIAIGRWISRFKKK